MNAKLFITACTVALGFAGAANASVPTYTLNWLVNGQESVIVNEGETVLVTGTASWVPAAHGFGSTRMRVELANSDASDSMVYAESLGMGRNGLLRMMPQAFTDSTISGGRKITGTADTAIDIAQLPQFMNPMYVNGNPVEIFRFEFVAGTAGRLIDIGSPIDNVNLYSNAMGAPTFPYSITVDGAQIQIVPTPGSMALLGLGGAVCLRRRRKN